MKTAIYVDFGSAVRVATFKGTLHINVSDKIFHTAMWCAEATITRWQASCFPNSIRLYVNINNNTNVAFMIIVTIIFHETYVIGY